MINIHHNKDLWLIYRKIDESIENLDSMALERENLQLGKMSAGGSRFKMYYSA